jgi:hypothetical protein
MNERIKLPDQEWLGYDPERGDMHGYTFDQMKDFAELIINECASIFEGVYTDQQRPERIDTRIKEHFGIEEPNNSLNFELSEGV